MKDVQLTAKERAAVRASMPDHDVIVKGVIDGTYTRVIKRGDRMWQITTYNGKDLSKINPNDYPSFNAACNYDVGAWPHELGYFSAAESRKRQWLHCHEQKEYEDRMRQAYEYQVAQGTEPTPFLQKMFAPKILHHTT